MVSTFYYLESPDGNRVVNWFLSRNPAPERIELAGRELCYFRDLGSLVKGADGGIDVRQSPLVSIIPPRLTNECLITMGEVHFLASNDLLKTVTNAFRRWLKMPDTSSEILPMKDDFGYFLEGEIKNITTKIHALPSGRMELESGRYFISDADAQRDQTALCKQLRLRGVACS